MSRGKKRAFTGFGVAMLAVLFCTVFFYFNFKTVQVSGISMEPTYRSGQRVLVSKAYWLIGPIQRKDIVVLKDTGPTGFMIKRVYRMAGEAITDASYLPEKHRLSDGPYLVPEGTLFVVGDNMPNSEDSRKFGEVPLEDVLGKVVVLP